MKTGARFLALILAVLMIAGAAITASANAFSDVEAGYDYETAINTLSQMGILNGVGNGEFKPEDKVERAQMAKIIYVLYTTFQDAGSNATKFADVAADNWANGFIAWCTSAGIVNGYGDGKFGPYDHVTYDQALKMVCGALGYKDFDSTLWPVDVRQKALKDLKLGEKLEKVKGNDEMTRGQVAQLIYNALGVDMAETKIEYVYDEQYVDDEGNPVKVKVPVEVAKTLMEDVWNCEDDILWVIATENLAFEDCSKTGEEDVILLSDNEEYELKDLGLEAYEGKTDDLLNFGIQVVALDGEILPKATVVGKKYDDLKIKPVLATAKTSKDKTFTYKSKDYALDKVEINGVVYEDDKKNDELYFSWLYTYMINDGEATTEKFVYNEAKIKSLLNNKVYYEGIDCDGDGYIDCIASGNYNFYEVTGVKDVKKTSSEDAYTKVTYKQYGSSSEKSIKASDITTATELKKGDCFVAAVLNGKMIVDAIVEPVEDYATSYSKGKFVTLAKAGKVTLDSELFVEYTTPKYLADDIVALKNGKHQINKWYIYDGKLLASTAADDDIEFNTAVLCYVDEPTDPVLDPSTKKFVSKYPAVLNIAGVEKTVYLDAKLAIDDKDADYAFANYKLDKNEDGTAKYCYTLVRYEVNKDGFYELYTLPDEFDDNYIVATGADFKYNSATGLYTVGDYKKVVIDDTTVIYYEYNKKSKGEYKYLGTYTNKTILKKFNTVKTASFAHLVYDEDTGLYTLKAVKLTGKLFETKVESTWDNDARLLVYCAENSIQEIDEEDGEIYYSHLFLDMDNMKNPEKHVADKINSKEDGAKETKAGNFYGYDTEAKAYVKADEGNTECLNVYTIDDMLDSKNLIFTKEKKYESGLKITDSMKIWALSGTELDEYVELDYDELKEVVELAGRKEKDVEIVVGTYIDDNDDEQVAFIVVEYYYETDSGSIVPASDAIIENVKAK